MSEITSTTPSDTSNMVVNLSLAITNWVAWAPGLESRMAWLQWAALSVTQASKALIASIQEQESHPVDTSFMPPALRKRLSQTTKVSLWLVNRLTQDCPVERRSTETVFASRHGESLVTAELLEDIAKDEALSPGSFSRSVHNTASGIFGISEGNTTRTTAISAMSRTFEMGLVHACAALTRAERVIYIMADDQIPPVFAPYLNEPWPSYGLALELTKAPLRSFHFGHPELPDALSFLRNNLVTD